MRAFARWLLGLWYAAADRVRKPRLWKAEGEDVYLVLTRKRNGSWCGHLINSGEKGAGPRQSAVSRRNEAEADWAALNTTRNPAAFVALFRDFAKYGLADPDPPGWFHVLFEDHPSGLERIEMARAWSRARQ